MRSYKHQHFLASENKHWNDATKERVKKQNLKGSGCSFRWLGDQSISGSQIPFIGLTLSSSIICHRQFCHRIMSCHLDQPFCHVLSSSSPLIELSYMSTCVWSGPKELGEYLLKLDKDDELYNEYFQVGISKTIPNAIVRKKYDVIDLIVSNLVKICATLFSKLRISWFSVWKIMIIATKKNRKK